MHKNELIVFCVIQYKISQEDHRQAHSPDPRWELSFSLVHRSDLFNNNVYLVIGKPQKVIFLSGPKTKTYPPPLSLLVVRPSQIGVKFLFI